MLIIKMAKIMSNDDDDNVSCNDGDNENDTEVSSIHNNNNI